MMTTPQQQAYQRAYQDGITEGIRAERQRIAKLLEKMTSKYKWATNPEYTLLSIEGMFKDLGVLEPVAEYDPES